MAGHPVRNLSVRRAVNQSGGVICENSQRGSPTAMTSATRVNARLPSCISIDVRRWQRAGRLCPGLSFSCSWSRGEEPFGSINVRPEIDAVVLMYRARSREEADWKSVEQRVPITWTACHLGGHRPWFACSGSSGGRYCGRRVAVLYGAAELFACRHCYGLTYASQREASYSRDLGK